MKGFYYCF